MRGPERPGQPLDLAAGGYLLADVVQLELGVALVVGLDQQVGPDDAGGVANNPARDICFRQTPYFRAERDCSSLGKAAANR